jgi:hypothetical protein
VLKEYKEAGKKAPIKHTRHNTPGDTKTGAYKPIPKQKKYNTYPATSGLAEEQTQQLHLKRETAAVQHHHPNHCRRHKPGSQHHPKENYL